MKDHIAGLRHYAEPLPWAVGSRVIFPLRSCSLAFYSARASAQQQVYPGSWTIRNPAVPVAWPCVGKISALRVTWSWRTTQCNDSQLEAKMAFSFRETDGNVEFCSLSPDIFPFAPRFPEMDTSSFLWEGSRNIKLLNSALFMRKLLSKGRHASLHSLLPQVFGIRFWKRHLHNEEPMLSALACGMHVRLAVSSFYAKTGTGLLWPSTWLQFPVAAVDWQCTTFLYLQSSLRPLFLCPCRLQE